MSINLMGVSGLDRAYEAVWYFIVLPWFKIFLVLI